MADASPDAVDSFMAQYGGQDQAATQPAATASTPTAKTDGVEDFISHYGNDALISDRGPDEKLDKQRFHIPGLDQADEWRDNVFRAFGIGAAPGFEAQPGGWSAEGAKFAKAIGIYDETKDGHETIMSHFNRQVLGPPASAILNRMEAAYDVSAGLVQGTAAAVAQGVGSIFGPSAGREFGAIVESGGGLAGSPEALAVPRGGKLAPRAPVPPKLPPEIVAARDLGVIGPEGEAAYYGHQSAPVREQTDEIILHNTPTPPAQPDIGAIARRNNPDLFNEFDALASQKATFSQWIDELQSQRAAGTSPQVAELDKRIDSLRADYLGTQGAERRNIANQIIDLEEQREAALPKTGDTPEIAKIRQDMMNAEFRMRDLAPQVSGAYREAQNQSAVAAIEPATDVTTAAETQASPTNEIAQKVSSQLVTAGRPQEEADAAGAVAQAYWETRAARFQGKKGTADEMFAREGATYQPEGAPEPEGALEFAQPSFTREQAQAEIQEAIDADYERRMQSVRLRFREGTAEYDFASAMARRNAEDWINQPEGREYLTQSQFAKDHPDYAATLRDYLANNYEAIAEGQPFHANVNRIGEVVYNQARRGKIAITEGRKTVTLMKTADASTFIHESGHEYLENLMADAVDRDAPDQLRADAQTVRDYLGNDGGRLTKAQHEKFARGFERYLMEGVAPSRGLARVFSQFKNWLTAIYRTVSRLRSPITDDIRAVFDRMLAETPERTVITPETETTSIAAKAEEAAANAAQMPPLVADREADAIRQQADEFLATNAPEIANELGIGATEAGAGEAAGGVSDRGGVAGQPQSAGAAGGEARGAVGAGRGEAETTGAGGNGAGGPPRGGAGTSGGETGKASSYETFIANLNTTDDAHALLRQIGDDHAEFSAARGFLSDGERNEIAEMLALDPARVTQAIQQQATDKSGAPMAAHLWAARNLIPKMVQDVWDSMGTAARDGATDMDAITYVKAQERLITMMNAILDVRAQMGRGLRAFHRISDFDAFKEAEDLLEFFQSATGKTPRQVREQAKLGLQLKTQSERTAFARQAAEPTRWETFKSRAYTWVMNALLSNPATHAAYAVGNRLLQTKLVSLDIPIAAGMRRLTGAETGYHLDEAAAASFALSEGGRYGLIAAQKAFKSGVPVLQGLEELKKFFPEAATNPELLPAYFHQLTRDFPGVIGKSITLPQKSIAFIHTYGYSQAFEVAATLRAFEKARDEGLEGEQLWARAGQIRMNGLTKDDLEAAHKEGMRSVLMRRPEYGTPMYHVGQFTNKSFVGRMAVPFAQIWANKMDVGLQHEPVFGFLRPQTRADLSGKNGIYKKQLAQARIAAGAGFITSMIFARASDLVTGPGPADPKEQSRLRQMGWQPFSIHVNGGYYPMAKWLGPIALPFQVAASYYDMGVALAHTAKGAIDWNGPEFDKGIGETANVVAATFEHAVMDDFFLRGVADLFENWAHGTTSFANNLAQTAFSYAVPYSSALRFIAESTDKYRRTERTPAEAFMRNLPAASEQLYPQRDLFGVPVPSSTFLSGTKQKTGPAWEALERVNAATGYWPGWPRRDLGAVELSEKGYDDYCRIAGQNFSDRMAVLATPGFTKMPMDQQEAAIKEQLRRSREDAARNRILVQDLAESKALKRQSMIEKSTQTKRAAIVGGPQFSPWSQ